MNYYGNNDWRDYQSLKHWKYIKREKVNGKWRYYYDDVKSDKLHVGKTTKIANRWSVNVSGFGTVGNGESYKVMSPETNNEFKEVSKEEWEKTKDGKALYIGNKKAGTVIKEQANMAKNAVKDTVKNKLGITDKELMKEAAAKKAAAEEQLNKDKADFNYRAHEGLSKATKSGRSEAVKQYNASKERFNKSNEAYTKAGEEYAKAQAAYMKTPVAKISKAKTAVSSWLKKKFKIH